MIIVGWQTNRVWNECEVNGSLEMLLSHESMIAKLLRVQTVIPLCFVLGVVYSMSYIRACLITVRAVMSLCCNLTIARSLVALMLWDRKGM
jgi:hypothetical protein